MMLNSVLDPTASKTQTGQTQTQAEQARSTLSNNFDTFLTLLTTQLQNQDPLDPMDSSKFTEQLVQYSQVEQQISTNDKLTNLTDTLTKQIQATSAGAALAYIGKTAMFNSDGVTLKDGAADWDYALESASASTTLTITDANGKTVFTTTGDQGAGAHHFTWNGKNSNGDSVPDGVYHLAVTAADASNKKINTGVTVTETITGVDMSGSDAAVMTASGSRDFTSILKIGG